MTKTVLITRPKTDADTLAEILSKHGVKSLVSPVLEIRTLDRPSLQIGGVQGILITSLNGARTLAARVERRDIPIFAVGPATGAALSASGFETVEAAASDIKSLANLVAKRLDPTKGPLVHAGGAVLAGDLKKLLEVDGFRIRREVLYSADRADALANNVIAALESGAVTDAVFYSPRSMESTLALAEKADITSKLAQVRAICLSAAVARTVPDIKIWSKLLIAPEVTQGSLIDVILDKVEGTPFTREMPSQTQIHPDIIAAEATANEISDTEIKTEHTEDMISVNRTGNSKPETDFDHQSAPDPRAKARVAPIASTTVIRRGTPLWLVLPLTLATGILGAAALPLIKPYFPMELLPLPAVKIIEDDTATTPDAPAFDPTSLLTRINETDNQVTTLKSESEEIRETLAALTDFIAEIPIDLPSSANQPNVTATEIESITRKLGQLDQLQDAVGNLEAQSTDAVVTALQILEEKLTARVAEAHARSTILEAALERRDNIITGLRQTLDVMERDRKIDASSLILALNVLDLQRAVLKGQPLGAPLDAVRFRLVSPETVSKSLDTLNALRNVALPTTVALQLQFAHVVDQTFTVVGKTPKTDWVGRTLERLASTVIIRRRDGDVADLVNAKIITAEAAVARGDLKTAAITMQGLPAYTQAAWQKWVVAVDQRLRAEAAVDDIQRHTRHVLSNDGIHTP